MKKIIILLLIGVLFLGCSLIEDDDDNNDTIIPGVDTSGEIKIINAYNVMNMDGTLTIYMSAENIGDSSCNNVFLTAKIYQIKSVWEKRLLEQFNYSAGTVEAHKTISCSFISKNNYTSYIYNPYVVEYSYQQ